MEENMYVVCMNGKSKVYHLPTCEHVKKMSKKNKLYVTKKEIKKMRLRPCKHCDVPKYRYLTGLICIGNFLRNNNIQYYADNDNIYLKTEIGIWKIRYNNKYGNYTILHGNKPYTELSIDNLKNAYYHFQGDAKKCKTVMQCAEYICKHDKFRKQVMLAGGDEKKVSVNKKYKQLRERKEKRQAQKRLEMLFDQIEREKRRPRMTA